VNIMSVLARQLKHVAFAAVIASAVAASVVSAGATTFTGGLGTQADPTWSVTVDAGITLEEVLLFTGSTVPPGPPNQGYNAGSGHLLDWLNNTAGFPQATLVPSGQIGTMAFTATDADLFGVHFGCGNSGPCELLWLFSGDTTFTVNTLKGFSNISAFNEPQGVTRGVTPLPAALPLFGGGLGVVGWLTRRRKKKAAA
jgi:hypothetical protein